MQLDEQNKIKHVGWTIALGYIGAFITFSISLFFPLDFSTDPPTYPKMQMIFQEISLALYIFSCTVLGLKLAEEKKTLPAAGFTMMAIAQGLYFAMFFVGFDTHESLVETYKVFCGFMYLLIPAMILISFYGEFPRWLNLLGIASCIPNAVVYIKFIPDYKYTADLDYISFFSFMLFNVTALIWGILILKNMKRDLKGLKAIALADVMTDKK